MNIQIGMSCDPAWLCQSIGWVVGAVVVAGIIGLIKVIRSDYKNTKKKRPK